MQDLIIFTLFILSSLQEPTYNDKEIQLQRSIDKAMEKARTEHLRENFKSILVLPTLKNTEEQKVDKEVQSIVLLSNNYIGGYDGQ
ncbi:hypothetical protein H8D85_02045 [bacterium]|nr:hypothetical protein [bacterium]